MPKIVPTQPGQTTTRRKFLNRIWALFGVVAAMEFSWFGLLFFNSRKSRNQPTKTESIITVGPIEQFTPGTVYAVSSSQFYLARLDDGGFLALSHTCTHLGCSVLWDEDKGRFVCPCHGSSFSLTGEVLTAPATRPLNFFPLRIEDGIVKVDITTIQKRQRFEPSQVVRL